MIFADQGPGTSLSALPQSSKRSATMTMLSCVAIVETRSEVVDCDIVQVQDQEEGEEHTLEPRS